MLQLGVQRQQAFVALELGQQFGAQVEQKTQAFREHCKSLQQARARRLQSAAQVHFGRALFGRAGCSLVALAGGFKKRGVGRKLLTHQQPQVAPLGRRCLGVPPGQRLCAAAAFDFAGARLHHRLQLTQHAAQHARRQGLLAAPQGGLQACVGAAFSSGLFLAGGTGSRCVRLVLRRAGQQPCQSARPPVRFHFHALLSGRVSGRAPCPWHLPACVSKPEGWHLLRHPGRFGKQAILLK